MIDGFGRKILKRETTFVAVVGNIIHEKYNTEHKPSANGKCCQYKTGMNENGLCANVFEMRMKIKVLAFKGLKHHAR